MHYYNFHIGDYKSHTHHLSLIEDLAYRRLLDLYYLTEKPIIGDQAARLIGMREHGHEVLCILVEFFEETPQGFISKRADDEIEAYYARVEQASKAGKASAQARKNSRSTAVKQPFNSAPTVCQLTNNQEPITNNHKKTKDTYSPSAHLVSLGADESIVKDWLTLRKAKKAAVTETAINGIVREAKKAMWPLSDVLAKSCERGWTGFKAEWVAGEVAPNVAAANPGELITLPDGSQITRAQQSFLKRVMA